MTEGQPSHFSAPGTHRRPHISTLSFKALLARIVLQHGLHTQAVIAKLFASEMAQRVASLCIDLHGGYGFRKAYPVKKLYRDAKIGTIYEGTSNPQRQIIAKALMR